MIQPIQGTIPAYTDLNTKHNRHQSESTFGSLLEQSTRESKLLDAAKQMEIQLATFMLKTMDAASIEGGLLGKTYQGMGYFKDVFFESMAQRLVEDRGLGFAESLVNTYNNVNLATRTR